MTPIFTASSTCNYSLPTGTNQDFEFTRQNCITQYFYNSSSSVKFPVTFETPTTSTSTPNVASSSDFYIDPYFSGGDIVLILILLLLLTITIIYSVVNSLRGIKTKKRYLAYNGGDVEIRNDN